MTAATLRGTTMRLVDGVAHVEHAGDLSAAPASYTQDPGHDTHREGSAGSATRDQLEAVVALGESAGKQLEESNQLRDRLAQIAHDLVDSRRALFERALDELHTFEASLVQRTERRRHLAGRVADIRTTLRPQLTLAQQQDLDQAAAALRESAGEVTRESRARRDELIEQRDLHARNLVLAGTVAFELSAPTIAGLEAIAQAGRDATARIAREWHGGNAVAPNDPSMTRETTAGAPA